MYIDTHCHLNFKSFEKEGELHYRSVIKRAQAAGVAQIIVPGTDSKTSQKAVEIAEDNEGVWAAVGIHPHHAMQYQISNHPTSPPNRRFRGTSKSQIKKEINQLETLIQHPKVVAVGEVGLDKHEYSITKYKTYTLTEEFVRTQKELCIAQLDLALQYDKSVILHNRKAKKELLYVLEEVARSKKQEVRGVFHCCEPDKEVLEFAKKHSLYIGVDGDVTYWAEKQDFIKDVPLEMLVIETDSPYLLPEPLRQAKKRPPNEPKNIPLIVEYVARLKGINVSVVEEKTTENAKKLFGI